MKRNSGRRAEKAVTTVNLPTDLIHEVKAIAEGAERSFSGQVAFFLRQSLLRHNKKNNE